MSNKYCLECGGINGVTANFCSSCGSSFVNLKASTLGTKPNPKPKPKIAPPKKPVVTADLDDNDDDDEPIIDSESATVPQIDSLDVEVRASQPRKMSVSDLASGANKTYQTNNIKVNKKSVLEEFRREASAIKPKR